MLTLRAFPQALGDEQVARALHAYYGALEDPSRVSAGSRALRAIGPRLKATAVDGRTRAFVVAAIATLGDLDGAFSLLDELLFPAAGERSSVDLSDLWCPEMRAFRAHSRFRTLVRRLGLADYWRNTNTAPQDPSALS
jgi:hypothetical protein